jgi:putative ABC transport system permease protein
MNLRRITESVALAFDTLRTNKFRSALTILGVVIGTATVMTVAAFISGLDSQFEKLIDSFAGRHSVFVFKFDPTFNHGSNLTPEERKRKNLTIEDAEALRQECASVQYVSARVSPWDADLKVSANGTELWSVNGQCAGVQPDFGRMETAGVEIGRFFNENDDQFRRPLAVIGSDVATHFWPNRSPLGQKLSVDNNEVEVIGVLKKQDNFVTPEEDGGNVDRAIYMPYNTMLKFFPRSTPGIDEIAILCQYRDGERDEALEQIQQVLRARRHDGPGQPDSFALITSDSFMEKFHQITAGIAILMFALSSAGLLIGGIGVMNIMLVSVTERTKEIGIRKAIGARRWDITSQFLIEAMTLTGMGGLLGIGIGWGLAALVGLILPTFVPAWAPIVGMSVSVGIGLVFGMWPAMKASRLDPIDALRYE